MVDKVWNSLEDDTVGVIGLYGMGGVGKTTLMKRIHNELGKRKHTFDLVLCVVVSRDCDINKLMNDISNKLGMEEDDLWEKLELETIGVPAPKENNKSKVMVTTRSEDVCGKMQAQKKLKVECLSDEEAFDLFCKKVGDETLKCHSEIPKLAREMTKECRGLPLALITVGSAMAGVESFEAWMDAKNNLKSSSWTASVLENRVFRILKFSYDKLPDKAHKSCFLYCALYPEDYEIYIDDLIDRWIAEGFLCKDDMSVYDMYNKGKSVIEKLTLSCLLEEGVDIESYFPRGDNMTVKMHDVIRDMALWLARDEDENKEKVVVQGEVFSLSKMDSKKLNVVERISIINDGNVERNWNLPACPNLITFCFQENVISNNNPSLSINFQSSKRLRVLDLSYTISLERISTEICELINLEFLNISGTYVHELPIELKKLKTLRVLLMDDMKSLGVTGIHLEVIESLKQLEVFRFSVPSSFLFIKFYSVQEEISLLEKLESLPKLEELSIHLTYTTSMQRLFHSTKLRGCSRRLKLNGKELGTLEISTLLASISELTRLDGILLTEMRCLVDGPLVTKKCHLGKLRQVRILFCHSITHLTWLRYAPLLEYLFVASCNSIQHVVKEARDDEEVDCESKNESIFTNLKDLWLERMSSLVSIHERALAFSSLKRIRVTGCPNLKKLPFNSSFASNNKLVAIQGESYWWNNLEWDNTIIEHLLRPKFRPMDHPLYIRNKY